MTSTELEFLTGVARDHGPTLDDETVSLMLDYFWQVHQTRPYLAHTLKLSTRIGELVGVQKEINVELMSYVEDRVIPEALESYGQVKQTELDLNAKSVQRQARRGFNSQRSPEPKKTKNAR